MNDSQNSPASRDRRHYKASVCATRQYEDYQHGNPHTRFKYALSQTLGFASLACFCIGYVWLILAVAR